MSTRNGYTPCDWPDCDRTIVDGWALFRVNPTGETGIFMCSEHAGVHPEEVADLMDTVAKAMEPDTPMTPELEAWVRAQRATRSDATRTAGNPSHSGSSVEGGPDA